MKRTILLIAAIFWFVPAFLFAQTPQRDSSPVMKELLAKPAPTPRHGATGEERHRSRLKLIASDRSQPATARFTAIHALSVTEWSNRDEWYLGLFEDETLIDPEDNGRRYAPLRELFSSNLEKWTPIMARLAESKDLTVRSAAASWLLSLHIVEARRDTLLPLLPWLSNPSWFTNEPSHRVSLIRKLTSVEIPESVPELIWIVENETRDNRSYAAQTLARYKDPRAVPALRRALMNQTQVGRYNLKDFSFKSILTLPHISFDSLSMWVDAKSEKLYVVYNGELLRLPFQSSAN